MKSDTLPGNPAARRTGRQRLLLFGASGQLGRALREAVGDAHELIAPASTELDLRDAEGVARFVRDVQPHLLVNAAAYTRVDDAEDDAERVMAINATAPAVMAAAAKVVQARMVHVSSDYVFDGVTGAPYAPGAMPHPLNLYGNSKLQGERAVLAAHAGAAVVRTAWVHSAGRSNFIATAVRKFTSGESMRVVDDQVGTPTHARHLAEALMRLAARPAVSGVLHFTDAGVASWYDVAHCVLETVRDAGRCPDTVQVTPVPSTAFQTRAIRPAVSLLDKHRSWGQIGWIPPHWRTGVIASTREMLDA